MEELRLVVVYTQELLPVIWYFVPPFYTPSGTFTPLLSCANFQAVLAVDIKHHINSQHLASELLTDVFHDLCGIIIESQKQNSHSFEDMCTIQREITTAKAVDSSET